MRDRAPSDGQPSLHIVIPVLNEAPNMERLFFDLRQVAGDAHGLTLRVLLVDDGSTDGSAELARRVARDVDLTVLTHADNHGPGYAFGTAFAYLADRMISGDFVLTMEGDNTSRADLVSAMLRRAGEGYDAVFASPYMYGGGIVHTRPLRIFLSHVANTVAKELLGVHGLLTVSSFFRLYQSSAIQRLQDRYGDRVIERTGFESMVEVVMKMMYLDMSISEIPMVLDSTRRVGESKLSVVRTGAGYFALLLRKRAWLAAAGRETRR